MKLSIAFLSLITTYTTTNSLACQFSKGGRTLTDEELPPDHPKIHTKQTPNINSSGLRHRKLGSRTRTSGGGGGGGGSDRDGRRDGGDGGSGGGGGGSTLPPRDQFPNHFRTIDGTQNNIQNPLWGAADTEYIRISNPEYGPDNSPSGDDRPNPRMISNLVLDQTTVKYNSNQASDYLWQWGQFLDHDLDHGPLTESEVIQIDVPTCDTFFDPSCNSQATMSIHRTTYHDGADGVRQQINEITSYIDASNVYGSNIVRAAALRTFNGGKLKTGDHDLLPKNIEGLPNAGGTDSSFFLAGDVRSNEQVGLMSIHTLFVREHNYWADRIAREYNINNDEQIYQMARVIVAAEMQAITYREFLPLLLGGDALQPYSGYKSNVNAGVSNEFATAAYRVGHTMLNDIIMTPGVSPGFLELKDAFFNIGLIESHNIDPFLLGLSQQRAQEIDCGVVSSVRNFLFGEPGNGGHDLGSLNIMRGRDHGLPSFNEVRSSYGLSTVSSFDNFAGNEAGIVDALKSAYGDDISKLDPWVGMLAERHVQGSMVGKTLQKVLTDQFERVRDGDRFWYETYLSPDLRRLVNDQTLSRVIQRNTNISRDDIKDNVFVL